MLSIEANDGLNVNNGVHQCMQGGLIPFACSGERLFCFLEIENG